MLKFKVILQGEHYRIEFKKRNLIFWTSSAWKEVGFYVTRFVKSESANTAVERAFKIIKEELREIAHSTENSNLVLYQIQEDETSYDLYAPGHGFTFYVEERA